jgi:hypothetical protein
VKPRLPRLPIPLRPAHHETLTSYVARLAAVHALPYEDLWTCLSAPTGSGSRRLIVLDRLAAATARPAAALEHALPELRDPAPDWKQWRHYPQRACPLCTARHRGGIVRRLFAHHEMLCTRHGYWIGSTEFGIDHRPTPIGQLLPELTDAQHRHNRLVQRHGWKLALHAIAASQNVCVDLRFYGPSPQHTIHDQRIKILIPTASAFNGPRYIAAFHPEIVRLAELFCAPTWRLPARTAIEQFNATRIAGSNSHTGDRDAIAAKIAQAIGYPVDAILSNNGHLITFWLAGMGYGPYYEPDKTFPDTRAQTLDGTPSPNLKQREATHLRRAVREFAKNNLLVAAWNLPPLNVREIRKPDIPPQLVDVPTSNLAELLGLHDHDSRFTTEETRPREQDLSADPTGTARPDIDESCPVQA